MSNLIRKNILLVDDEPIFANSLSRKIKGLGYDVIIAYSGEEAIDIVIQNEQIHLVLMDIDLGSGMDGTETARLILTNQSLPVLFHTYHFEKEIVERVSNITRYGYVIKNSGDFVLQSSIEMAFELFEAHQKTKAEYATIEAFNRLSAQTNLLLNRITDSIVSLDKDWRYTYVNDSALLNFRKTREELIGNIIWDIFPDTVGTNFWEKPQEAMEKQIPIEFETYYGPYNIWFRIRCYPSKDGITILYQNITENKEIEKKAKEATNLLNSVVENIPNMIFIKNARDLRFALFNRAGEKLLGYNRNDLLGKNDYDFFPKEQADFFTQKDKDVLSRREALDIPEESIDTPHGTRILHTKKLPLLDESGQAQYLLGISEDITERKESEKKIRESIERYDRLTKTVPGALYDYVLHKDGRNQMLFMSSKCFEVFEIEADLIMQDMSIVWKMIHPDDLLRFQEENETSNRLGGHFSSEIRIITPSGKEKWIQLTSRPNPTHYPDEPAIWSGFIIDVTNRRLAEEKIKTLLQEKELLLQEVHHRIKNNMMTITSLLFLQIETLIDPAAIAALNDASSRIQSMIVLYDKLYRSTDFKELSVIEYLSPLVQEIVNNFPNYKIVKIEKRIDDFILPAEILFPIGIMVNEILTNAMKYAFIGREYGLLTVAAHKKENHILFSIQDDGVGMRESVQMETSTGFGLQLVKMLAKQIKGKIHIEREKGTKFTLEFELE